MNQLMQINHDKDVLKDEHCDRNAPIKRTMASYEKNQCLPGPSLDPMSPNWDELDGNWNEELFRLFVADCKDDGDGDKVEADKDQFNIHEMFMDRLQRLKGLINRCRPKDNERQEAFTERLNLRHKRELQRQRHHTRRGEVSRK
jgi:hypothetical protein